MKTTEAMTHTEYKKQEEAATIWERQSRPIESNRRSRVPRIAYVIILLMGLVALFAIGTSISNYMRSGRSVSDLHLEFTKLQLIDDGNPRAVVRFKLNNDSPLPVGIERFIVTLYVNEERVSSNASQFVGTDPNADPDLHQKVTIIHKTLDPEYHLDLEFTLYIYSAQMEIVRRAQHSGSMSWTATAGVFVTPPYAREVKPVGLRATLEE